MISEIWWKNMQKKEGSCHNQEERSYHPSTYKMELSSLPCCYITCIWVLDVQTFINSLNKLPRTVLVALFSLPSRLEDEEMKIPAQA